MTKTPYETFLNQVNGDQKSYEMKGRISGNELENLMDRLDNPNVTITVHDQTTTITFD